MFLSIQMSKKAFLTTEELHLIKLALSSQTISETHMIRQYLLVKKNKNLFQFFLKKARQVKQDA